MLLWFKNKRKNTFNADEYNKHVYISLEIDFPNNNIIAYFKDGKLYRVEPYTKVPLCYLAGYANKARYIVSDNIKYDLANIKSINSIPIPKYNSECEIGVTGMLEYVLKMHPETGDINLDIALLDKAISLMEYSYFDYSIDTYLQLPKAFYEIGEFEKGDLALEKIRNIKKLNPMVQKQAVLERVLKTAEDTFNNDLIEIPAQYTSCGECAKYQCRVYSAYGNDPRFPKLPQHILETGSIHDGCRHGFLNFFYHDGATIQTYNDNGVMIEVDAIQQSNRPFIDNRTEAEKQRYLKLPQRNNIGIDEEEKKLLNYREYCIIKYNNPDSAPKSFSAYMRAKNRKNKKE